MNQDIYVGFAVDANKAANDLENMTTAKFSNIQVNEEFVDVEYQLDKLTASGADYAVAGNDFHQFYLCQQDKLTMLFHYLS